MRLHAIDGGLPSCACPANNPPRPAPGPGPQAQLKFNFNEEHREAETRLEELHVYTHVESQRLVIYTRSADGPSTRLDQHNFSFNKRDQIDLPVIACVWCMIPGSWRRLRIRPYMYRYSRPVRTLV